MTGMRRRRSNCLKHLETNNIKDVASFLKATASDLKAIGFLTEVPPPLALLRFFSHQAKR